MINMSEELDLKNREEYQIFLKNFLKNNLKSISLKALEPDLTITHVPKMYAYVPIVFGDNITQDKYSITTKFKVSDQEFEINLLTTLSWSPTQFVKNVESKMNDLLVEQLNREIWIKFNSIFFRKRILPFKQNDA
jgi:hypothetical protein